MPHGKRSASPSTTASQPPSTAEAKSLLLLLALRLQFVLPSPSRPLAAGHGLGSTRRAREHSLQGLGSHRPGWRRRTKSRSRVISLRSSTLAEHRAPSPCPLGVATADGMCCRGDKSEARRAKVKVHRTSAHGNRGTSAPLPLLRWDDGVSWCSPPWLDGGSRPSLPSALFPTQGLDLDGSCTSCDAC